ncbi:MAG: hypothetical protein WC026_09885 [Hyphomicrobium sp.]|uniref:hypothetical protein n=1 Tax=Hyphomicrobium sp. TaxID=82 RepID=UPI0035652938
MRFVLGVLTGSAVLGLALAPVWASDAAGGRIGIERAQAESGTGGADAGRGGAQSPPDTRRHDDGRDNAEPGDDNDGGEEGSDENASPDTREPPGCTYRQEPLELIV